MTTTNGANHQTVEDLLSSIRNSRGDENGSLRQGPSSPIHSQMQFQNYSQNQTQSMARREAAMAEESAEFELPAIFKPGHTQAPTDRSSNIFGRLSDALKPAPAIAAAMTSETDRSRTVIRFEPASGRMIEPPAPPAVAQAARAEPPVEPNPNGAQSSSPMRREMPSFFDTRLNRLGEMTRQANAPKIVEPPPAPQAVAPQPPPLRPQPPPADASAGGLEDAAAQLLRPILKQWLTENMPKIVEKALRSEASDDYPPPGHGQGGRKPGQ
jgi:cell pole-organizing protein PopZ